MVVYAIPAGYGFIVYLIILGLIGETISHTHLYHLIAIGTFIYALATFWILKYKKVLSYLGISLGFPIAEGICIYISSLIIRGGKHMYDCTSFESLGVFIIILGILLGIAGFIAIFCGFSELAFPDPFGDGSDENETLFPVMAYVLFFIAFFFACWENYGDYPPEWYLPIAGSILIMNLICRNCLSKALLFSAIALTAVTITVIWKDDDFLPFLPLLACFGPSFVTGIIFSAVGRD